MKVETLDALAWASLSEVATLARLANRLVKETDEYGYPTLTKFKEAISSTRPPRGRAGPMLELLQAEYKYQKDIIWKRKHAHDEWAQHQKNIANREYRIQACYASAFGQAVHTGHRHNPLPWNQWEARRAWDDAECKRPKGDDCLVIFIQQDYTVALLASVNDLQAPQIRVRRRGYRYTVATLLREPAYNIGDLLVTLGGKAVTGALAHGRRVEIDYAGRKFTIHDEDGNTHEAPWHILEAREDDDYHVVVIGRKILSQDPKTLSQ